MPAITLHNALAYTAMRTLDCNVHAYRTLTLQCRTLTLRERCQMRAPHDLFARNNRGAGGAEAGDPQQCATAPR
eukprot:6969927-Prymnesium_polylepis.2